MRGDRCRRARRRPDGSVSPHTPSVTLILSPIAAMHSTSSLTLVLYSLPHTSLVKHLSFLKDQVDLLQNIKRKAVRTSETRHASNRAGASTSSTAVLTPLLTTRPVRRQMSTHGPLSLPLQMDDTSKHSSIASSQGEGSGSVGSVGGAVSPSAEENRDRAEDQRKPVWHPPPPVRGPSYTSAYAPTNPWKLPNSFFSASYLPSSPRPSIASQHPSESPATSTQPVLTASVSNVVSTSPPRTNGRDIFSSVERRLVRLEGTARKERLEGLDGQIELADVVLDQIVLMQGEVDPESKTRMR